MLLKNSRGFASCAHAGVWNSKKQPILNEKLIIAELSWALQGWILCGGKEECFYVFHKRFKIGHAVKIAKLRFKGHACLQQSSGSSCKCTSKAALLFWQPNHLTVSASYKCIGLTYILSILKPVPDWNTSTHRGPEGFQCDHWQWVEKPIRSSSQHQSLQDPVILHVAATRAKKDMLASRSRCHSHCFCATYWSPLFIFKHDGALCMASKQYPEHHQ